MFPLTQTFKLGEETVTVVVDLEAKSVSVAINRDGHPAATATVWPLALFAVKDPTQLGSGSSLLQKIIGAAEGLAGFVTDHLRDLPGASGIVDQIITGLVGAILHVHLGGAASSAAPSSPRPTFPAGAIPLPR